MSKSLQDALQGRAWSVSAVIFDLNDMLDDEGRPVSERRADAPVRAGVEMDTRPCPYAGARHGKWMNVSALNQISRHYNAVMDEIAAFRRQTGATWEDVLAGVLDQLARPTILLLQQRNERGPVQAQAAVGHKLAAGFFGVVRTLHERLALGGQIEVSVPVFLDLVDEIGALVGPAEVCAGSPQMIRKASTTLIEGEERSDLVLDRTRLDVARCLALQVQLGIFWKLYDRQHVWELIRGETRGRLRPSNEFLVRKLERAEDDVAAAMPPIPDVTCLPAGLDAAVRFRLADALLDVTDPRAMAQDLEDAAELMGQPGSAIGYDGAHAPFVQRVACYLHAYRLFTSEIETLERRLRELLGFAQDAPMRLGGTVFPLPQAQPWYEMVLGRRVGETGRLTGSSVGLRSKVA
ncbi:MAG: hypothetical protein OEY75_08260 [Hylemonella sp.]|nr:hypothetical protein [Hylemonella sp.]MDH5709094.1 hypothetical protein [Hylemonella sp.]